MSYYVFIQLETFAFKLLECNKILTLYKVKKKSSKLTGQPNIVCPRCQGKFYKPFQDRLQQPAIRGTRCAVGEISSTR